MGFASILAFTGLLATAVHANDQGSLPGLGPGSQPAPPSNIVFCSQKDYWGNCAYEDIQESSYGECLSIQPSFVNNIGSFKSFDPSLCCVFYTDPSCAGMASKSGPFGYWTQPLRGSVDDIWSTCNDPKVQGHLASFVCGKCPGAWDLSENFLGFTTWEPTCGGCARPGPCYGINQAGIGDLSHANAACKQWAKRCPNLV